jgi:hypothetical protein
MMTELEDARSLEIGFDGGRLLLPVGGTTRLANHRSVSGNRVDHTGGIYEHDKTPYSQYLKVDYRHGTYHSL